MPPKQPNVESEYKSKLKLYLEKLKNGEVQATKVDLTKISTRKLAKTNRCVKRRCKNVYVSIQLKEIML